MDSQRLLEERNVENRSLSEDLKTAVETNLELQEQLQATKSQLQQQTRDYEVLFSLLLAPCVKPSKFRRKIVFCKPNFFFETSKKKFWN